MIHLPDACPFCFKIFSRGILTNAFEILCMECNSVHEFCSSCVRKMVKVLVKYPDEMYSCGLDMKEVILSYENESESDIEHYEYGIEDEDKTDIEED
jgi:hypothetical protein